MSTSQFERFRRRTSFRLGPGGKVTPVVRILLALNIGIFLLELLAGWNTASPFADSHFALIPEHLWPAGLYTLITYMFLHGGFLHILFNMFMLWMFGTAIEIVWGGTAFLRYYMICGIGGGLVQALVSWGSPIPVIGASAAIMGLLLAYAMMYPDQKVYLWGIIGMKMKYLIALAVLIDLFGGLGRGGSHVAHFAHLGGMLFGWLYLQYDHQLNALVRRVRGARARWQMQQYAGQDQGPRPGDPRIDEILEKISRHGIESLTQREQEILRNASRH